jgi:hypothetical protein
MRQALEILFKEATPEAMADAKRALLEMTKGTDEHARTVATNMLGAPPFLEIPDPVDDWADQLARAWSGGPEQRVDALALLASRAPQSAAERRAQLADAVIANGAYIAWHLKADLRFVHILEGAGSWVPDDRRGPMLRMALSFAGNPSPGPGRMAMGFIRAFAPYVPPESMREVVDGLLGMAARPEYSAEALGVLVVLRPRMDPYDLARVDARMASRGGA